MVLCSKYFKPILLFIGFSCFFSLLDAGKNFPWTGMPGYYNQPVSRTMERYKQIGKINEIIKSRSEDLGKNGLNDEEKNLINQEIAGLRREVTRLINPYPSSRAKMGALIAKGLVGEDLEVLDDSEIRGIADGIWAGVTVRSARACGKVISDKIEGTATTVIGGAWDSILDTLLRWWSDATSFLLTSITFRQTGKK